MCLVPFLYLDVLLLYLSQNLGYKVQSTVQVQVQVQVYTSVTYEPDNKSALFRWWHVIILLSLAFFQPLSIFFLTCFSQTLLTPCLHPSSFRPIVNSAATSGGVSSITSKGIGAGSSKYDDFAGLPGALVGGRPGIGLRRSYSLTEIDKVRGSSFEEMQTINSNSPIQDPQGGEGNGGGGMVQSMTESGNGTSVSSSPFPNGAFPNGVGQVDDPYTVGTYV